MYVGGGTFAMSGAATIYGNIAHGSGGGVFITSGNIITDDSQVTTPGLFEMTGGTIGPDNTAKFGGGVDVGNGEFNMSGTAVILGNTATGIGGGNGGGVNVSWYGTFNMKGGTISGNTATGIGGGNGGGVNLVYSNSIFRIETGTIYGLNGGDNANTASSGAALYIQTGQDAGTAERGTFSGTTWNPATGGSLTTIDYTIKVVNGEVVQ